MSSMYETLFDAQDQLILTAQLNIALVTFGLAPPGQSSLAVAPDTPALLGVTSIKNTAKANKVISSLLICLS